MTAIARTLDAKLKQWRPATARKVARQVASIIKLAEQETQRRTRPKAPARRSHDPLLADSTLYSGRTPANLSSHHDRYLHDVP